MSLRAECAQGWGPGTRALAVLRGAETKLAILAYA